MDVISSLGLESLGVVLAVIVGALVVLFAASRATRMYHRVAPSKVMVVYGRGKTEFDAQGKPTKTGIRLVTGGGALVWPIFEEFRTLDLNVMTIEQPRDVVYTIDGIPLNLDWVALVQIGSDEVSLLTAARAFLGMQPEQIIDVITKTLSTNNRAIVGQMTVEELHRDRDAFVQKVQSLASNEMAAMGLSVKQMGVRDITDQEGYFEAMAAPKIAAIKRDAAIAQAEADREARVKSAEAKRAGEQAELDARTSIIQQQEALQLREVAQKQRVALAQAAADQEVQERRALVVKQEQEVEVLVPARAQAEAQKIKAEGDKVSAEIDAKKVAAVQGTQAEGKAEARRKEAQGEADATRSAAEAEAAATERKAIAEAKKIRETRQAEADGISATLTAQAEGTKAQLLAEAEGKQKIAEATAAEGEINLRQFVAESLIKGDVEKVQAIATALAGLGQNTRIVQLGGGQNGQTGNALVDLLMQVPELATVVNAKTEALSGGRGIEDILARVAEVMKTASTGKSEVGVTEKKVKVEDNSASVAVVSETRPVEASVVEQTPKRRRPGSKTQ